MKDDVLLFKNNNNGKQFYYVLTSDGKIIEYAGGFKTTPITEKIFFRVRDHVYDSISDSVKVIYDYFE